MRIRDLSSDVCSSDLMRLYDLKRELTYMRLAVTPLQDVLSQPVRTPGTLVAPGVRLYFRDVLDHSSSAERRVGHEVSVRVDLGRRRVLKNKNRTTLYELGCHAYR